MLICISVSSKCNSFEQYNLDRLEKVGLVEQSPCHEDRCGQTIYLRVPTSILWCPRETKAGVATVRRLAALRPDLPFTLIDNTKACPELERPTAVNDVIRADI